jgi:ribulose-phosphate 3-epimerase
LQNPIIVASVLGADYANLATELASLEAAGVDAVQWDVMDGRFVPPITFGADVVAGCRSATSLPFEAHLMIQDPENSVGSYIEAGCDLIIVHAESTQHLHRTLSLIRELGGKPAVAINPATPFEDIRHVMDLLDMVLVMTVNPGYGGQTFIESQMEKVREVRRFIDARELDCIVEVDGGIKAGTIGMAREAGAEAFISGSGILSHPDGYAAAVAELRVAVGA